MLQDSHEFLLLLLNRLHDELKHRDAGEAPPTGSDAELSPSDATYDVCDSERDSDVEDDCSSSSSQASADTDHVKYLYCILLIFLIDFTLNALVLLFDHNVGHHFDI